MTATASQRLDYARATIWAHLDAAGVGAALVPAESQRADLAPSAPWVRVGFDVLPPAYSGHVDGVRSNYIPIVVRLDVHAPDGGNRDVVDLYAADRIASACRAAMSHVDLSFSDYSDPASPVAVSGVVIEFHDPPAVQDIGPVDGWIRRRVTARGSYIERTTAA